MNYALQDLARMFGRLFAWRRDRAFVVYMHTVLLYRTGQLCGPSL